jgi:hypothetical protein
VGTILKKSCEHCGKTFSVKFKHRYQRFCDGSCSRSWAAKKRWAQPEFKERVSAAISSSMMNDPAMRERLSRSLRGPNWSRHQALIDRSHRCLDKMLGRIQRCEACGHTKSKEKGWFHWGRYDHSLPADANLPVGNKWRPEGGPNYRRLCVTCHNRWDQKRGIMTYEAWFKAGHRALGHKVD